MLPLHAMPRLDPAAAGDVEPGPGEGDVDDNEGPGEGEWARRPASARGEELTDPGCQGTNDDRADDDRRDP